MKQYFGKYRGKVENNLDPMMQGRLQVSVASVLGSGTLYWAMPCVPMAGPQMGIFALPPRNANVWVEFEAGDPNKPIWSGCFWGLGEYPPSLPVPEGMSQIFVKTKMASLTLDDTPGTGGLVVEMTGMGKVEMKSTGMTVTNSQGATISLGPGPKLSINNGAIEVLF